MLPGQLSKAESDKCRQLAGTSNLHGATANAAVPRQAGTLITSGLTCSCGCGARRGLQLCSGQALGTLAVAACITAQFT